MGAQAVERRLPIGAEVQPNSGVHFRVWAPARRRVRVVVRNGTSEREFDLARDEMGYFSGEILDARVGMAYGFRLDDDPAVRPDPASRFQPDGPHGWSVVVDASRYRWNDGAWRGVKRDGAVIYEAHVGTFTHEGTYAALSEHLGYLVDLGVTVLELMPVAEFPGRFGWGYDGVDLFAPSRLYGTPDDLRRLVDQAHALGLGVILDVVYNHFGPDGNYLGQFASNYVSQRHGNEWGDAIDFDGPESAGVREFFISNARYWIDEFHFDGLRLDATHAIVDHSPQHILMAINDAVRDAAKGRATFLVAECESQDGHLVRAREQRGFGLDAAWNDDWHHSARVALTGHREAYYRDYTGSPQSFVSAAKHGYLYQGQRFAFHQRARGSSTRDIAPAAFVAYLENHDQVANSTRGARISQLASPARLRALTTCLLLGPSTPMLFQGQEFASSRPFLYFADHHPELAALVAKGRAESLSHFATIATDAVRSRLDAPHDEATFTRCILDHDERAHHAATLAFHRELLRLRRTDHVIAAQGAHGIDGAVLDAHAFVLRFFAVDPAHDRLLVVNLGPECTLDVLPEPLLAPPPSHRFATHFSSDDVRWGGDGALPIVDEDGRWTLRGECAALLIPVIQRRG